MERPRIVTRALLIAGLSVTGAFGNPARSEAAPPDIGSCRITQTTSDRVLIVCNNPQDLKKGLKEVKTKCIGTKTEPYGHPNRSIVRLNTALQKDCWGPVSEYTLKTVLKFPSSSRLPRPYLYH